MNSRLTPGVILLALLVGAVYGPAQTLAGGLTRDQLVSANYWLDLAAAGITSFAQQFLAVVAIVAAALGLPLYQATRGGAGGASAPPNG